MLNIDGLPELPYLLIVEQPILFLLLGHLVNHALIPVDLGLQRVIHRHVPTDQLVMLH